MFWDDWTGAWGGAVEVFKAVDTRHADAVAKGAFFIGTAARYAKLESERRDPLDSRLLRHVDAVLDYSNPADREAAARINISLEPGAKVELSDVRHIQMERPEFLLCFAKTPEAADFKNDGSLAVFRITDVESLARELTAVNQDRLGIYFSAAVSYMPVQVTLFDQARASPFRKDTKFFYEEEWRVAWTPASGAYNRHGFIARAPGGARKLIQRIY